MTALRSCDFDSSVGRALHWYHRGRGFQSRSKPEFFSGLCFSSVTAAFAFDIYLGFGLFTTIFTLPKLKQTKGTRFAAEMKLHKP